MTLSHIQWLEPIQNMTTNHESIILGKGDNMSPKLRAAQYTTIIPERVKQVAQQRNVKMKDLASAVGTVYENFSRQIRKGSIQKDWLETICDELNVSRDYLTGSSEKIGMRSNDFNRTDKQREALKQLMLYSRHGSLAEKVDAMSDYEIGEITTDITFMLLEWDQIQEERRTQMIDTNNHD